MIHGAVFHIDESQRVRPLSVLNHGGVRAGSRHQVTESTYRISKIVLNRIDLPIERGAGQRPSRVEQLRNGIQRNVNDKSVGVGSPTRAKYRQSRRQISPRVARRSVRAPLGVEKSPQFAVHLSILQHRVGVTQRRLRAIDDDRARVVHDELRGGAGLEDSQHLRQGLPSIGVLQCVLTDHRTEAFRLKGQLFGGDTRVKGDSCEQPGTVAYISAWIDLRQIRAVDFISAPETVGRLARDQRNGTVARSDVEKARSIGKAAKELGPNVAQLQRIVWLLARRACREPSATIV